MKTRLFIKPAIIICMLIVFASGCSKSNEEQFAIHNPVACDTTQTTYLHSVKPILQANCYGCHGNGLMEGGIMLDTYDNVKQQADNGTLLGTISHAAGYPAMPYNSPKLSDCDINTIRAWINNGAKNN